MVEEDLFFPGKLAEDDDEDIRVPLTKDDHPSSLKSRVLPDQQLGVAAIGLENANRAHVLAPFPNSEGNLLEAPKPMDRTLLESRQPNTNTNENASAKEEQDLTSQTSAQSTSRTLPPSLTPNSSPPRRGAFIPPHSRSSARPMLQVKTQPKESSHSDLFGSSVSLLGTGYSDPLADLVKKQQQQAQEQNTAQRGWSPVIPPVANAGHKKAKVSPFLLRSLTKSPVNPRDHTILATVWKGMLETRFVNMTPLSLLTTYMEFHFKGA